MFSFNLLKIHGMLNSVNTNTLILAVLYIWSMKLHFILPLSVVNLFLKSLHDFFKYLGLFDSRFPNKALITFKFTQLCIFLNLDKCISKLYLSLESRSYNPFMRYFHYTLMILYNNLNINVIFTYRWKSAVWNINIIPKLLNSFFYDEISWIYIRFFIYFSTFIQ